MKNLLIVFILSLVFASCSHLGGRKPAGERSKRHIIITLHGVRGNATSYGMFHKFIKQHLEAIDPTYEVQTINFVFNNGKEAYDKERDLDLFNPDLIADNLNKWIDRHLLDPSNGFAGDGATFNESMIRDTDKISVVAYSMGSLVGLNWFYKNMNMYEEIQKLPVDSTERREKERYFRYVQKVENFINLGGAIYGSFLANYGIDKNMRKLINMSSSLGDTSFGEVVALSSGSPTAYNIRQGRIKSKQSPYNEIIKTEFTSIVGLFPCLADLDQSDAGCQRDLESIKAQLGEFASEILSGGVRLEADGPVQAPSANNEFLYYSDLLNPQNKNKAIKIEHFKSTKSLSDKIILADVSHATLDGGEKINDVVIIPPRCEKGESCDHPNYIYELQILSGCDKPNSSCDQEVYNQYMKSFSSMKYKNGLEAAQKNLESEVYSYGLELNLRIPDGIELPENIRMDLLKYIKFDFEDKNFVANYRKNSWLANLISEKASAAWNSIKFWGDKKEVANMDGLLVDRGEAYVLRIARALEMESTYARVYEVNGARHLRINFRGQINDNSKNEQQRALYEKAKMDGVPLRFQIAIPGLKQRTATVPVKTLYSTYLDLVMEK